MIKTYIDRLDLDDASILQTNLITDMLKFMIGPRSQILIRRFKKEEKETF